MSFRQFSNPEEIAHYTIQPINTFLEALDEIYFLMRKIMYSKQPTKKYDNRRHYYEVNKQPESEKKNFYNDLSPLMKNIWAKLRSNYMKQREISAEVILNIHKRIILLIIQNNLSDEEAFEQIYQLRCSTVGLQWSLKKGIDYHILEAICQKIFPCVAPFMIKYRDLSEKDVYEHFEKVYSEISEDERKIVDKIRQNLLVVDQCDPVKRYLFGITPECLKLVKVVNSILLQSDFEFEHPEMTNIYVPNLSLDTVMNHTFGNLEHETLEQLKCILFQLNFEYDYHNDVFYPSKELVELLIANGKATITVNSGKKLLNLLIDSSTFINLYLTVVGITRVKYFTQELLYSLVGGVTWITLQFLLKTLTEPVPYPLFQIFKEDNFLVPFFPRFALLVGFYLKNFRCVKYLPVSPSAAKQFFIETTNKWQFLEETDFLFPDLTEFIKTKEPPQCYTDRFKIDEYEEIGVDDDRVFDLF